MYKNSKTWVFFLATLHIKYLLLYFAYCHHPQVPVQSPTPPPTPLTLLLWIHSDHKMIGSLFEPRSTIYTADFSTTTLSSAHALHWPPLSLHTSYQRIHVYLCKTNKHTCANWKLTQWVKSSPISTCRQTQSCKCEMIVNWLVSMKTMQIFRAKGLNCQKINKWRGTCE